MSTIPKLQVLVICFTFCLLASSWLHPCKANPSSGTSTKEYKIKGMFVFGTSVVDNGNNNYINGTLSKVNYLPYGIDFPFGPTGRYSNGKNVADLIGHLLRLPLIPPFADPRTNDHIILHGVNYGSGGSGILDDTGSITGGVLSMNEQINKFEEATLPELKNLLGRNPAGAAQEIHELDEYLFLVAAGDNDFMLNYFLQQNSSRPTLPVFVANLTSTYASQLQRLYNLGARKFALLTVYPIGCSPLTMQKAKSQQCVQTANSAILYFNTQLITMVDALNQRLPGSHFVVVNTYQIIRDIINNPTTRDTRTSKHIVQDRAGFVDFHRYPVGSQTC